MALLAANGVGLDLPDGWEGRIRRRETVSAQDRVTRARQAPLQPPVVAHAASFPLAPGVADFGGGAVEGMRPEDVFIAIVEFDRDSADTTLFRRAGMLTVVRAEDFHPQALQRPLPGQGGLQHFCVEAGRPFCLYIVLGSLSLRRRTLPAVNDLLSGVRIG